MDIQIMTDHINGLISHGTELRKKEAIFLKLQGIDEELSSCAIEKSELETKQADLKKEIADLKDKKRLAIEGTVLKLTGKMNEVLPDGEAVFNVDDGVFIGWKKEGKTIPYEGLSGGQKSAFDAALAYALKANILAIEAAEIDSENITTLLNKIAGHDTQVLVMTCHNPSSVPEGFNIVEVGGVTA